MVVLRSDCPCIFWPESGWFGCYLIPLIQIFICRGLGLSSSAVDFFQQELMPKFIEPEFFTMVKAFFSHLRIISLKFGIEVRFGILNRLDRKSTRLNSSHVKISYAVSCLK